MRPTPVAWIVIGIIVALDVTLSALWVLTQSSGGKEWHYWLAPLLALQTALLLGLIAFGYFWKVGRLELRGRPRGD